MMCAAQSFDKSLAAAEYEMMDRFVTKMGTASLLCDLVDAETVGLENALRVIKNHPETDRVGVRVDSGDIAAQCVLYFQKMKTAGHPAAADRFRGRGDARGGAARLRGVPRADRHRADDALPRRRRLLVAAGPPRYRERRVQAHRDRDRPNVKFSNSPGKETISGYIRVYGRGDTMIVADKSEDASTANRSS